MLNRCAKILTNFARDNSGKLRLVGLALLLGAAGLALFAAFASGGLVPVAALMITAAALGTVGLICLISGYVAGRKHPVEYHATLASDQHPYEDIFDRGEL